MDKYNAARDILRAIVDKKGLYGRLERYISHNMKIVLYGASELGDIILKECQKEGIKIEGICDRMIIRDGWKYMDTPLISLNHLSEMKNVVVLVTAVGFENEIIDDLKSKGVRNVLTIQEAFRE